MTLHRDAPQVREDAAGSVSLRIRELRKSFGDAEVLKGIDLDVQVGEFLTLLGPSGSGKTTLLRIIAGFEGLTSGSMQLKGRELSTLTPGERDLGMVFQQYALFPHMTVAENIGYGLKLRKWRGDRLAARVDEMLEMVGLQHLRHRKPRNLSGGQQQRVALARALAYGPQLLLMDEPLGALDRSLRLQMEEEIRRVHRQLGTTVVYVTHDQEEALILSDRIAIMQEGVFAGLDTPDALFQRPPSSFVARFFSDSNVLDGEATPAGAGSRISCLGNVFGTPARYEGSVRLAVRPRSLVVDDPTDREGVALSGVVEESMLLGDDRRIEVAVPEVGRVVVLEDSARSREYAIGQQVSLFVPAEKVTVMTS